MNWYLLVSILNQLNVFHYVIPSGTLPKVSYAKGLDWYLLVSLLFIFLSVVESTVVFTLTENRKDKIKKSQDKYKVSK